MRWPAIRAWRPGPSCRSRGKPAQADIERLKAEKSTLEASLVRLRDKTLDLDYVEEIARTKLSFVRPDELLVAVR